MKGSTDPRHQARRLAFQALFKWAYQSEDSPAKLLNQVLHGLGDKNNLQFDHKLAGELLAGALTNLNDIDLIITQAAPEWPIDQIGKVDAAILRLSIFELLYYNQTPPKVAIDEAVELAKEFGGANSASFVNGVLGTVATMREENIKHK